MVRESKPYARPDGKRGNPDASWKHDMHETVQQTLASRLSSGSSAGGRAKNVPTGPKGRPDLLSRISGSGSRGIELIPSSSSAGPAKMHGYSSSPPVNLNVNPNAGVELLGPGPIRRKSGTSGRVMDSRIVASGMDAAGLSGAPRVVVRHAAPVAVAVAVRPSESVSIFGAARGIAAGPVIVRVENLAPGTTAEDVKSAFSASPIDSATLTHPQTGDLVSVDLELASRTAADELISQYNGVVADGNALRLSIVVVRQSLGERMGGGVGSSKPSSSISSRLGNSRELIAPSSGKMYSDTILRGNASSAIITLGDTSSSSASRSRADAWGGTGRQRSGGGGGGSLADRVGNGRGEGRGQIGGGSYADMMVD